jgi:adenylosuccinate lyase
MLGLTHGQPALATTFGKEMQVFAERLRSQLKLLMALKIPVKFGGAVGTSAAHILAYPEVDWEIFADKLTYRIGTYDDQNEMPNFLAFNRIKTTTQIEPHDGYAAIFDNVRRINVILLAFSRDMWTLISRGVVGQKTKKSEVGSSTMPQKVNPLDFENAEGNLQIADWNFDGLSNKLPISRLQRDLSDSTVMRFVGVPFGHSLIAYESLLKGIGKIIPHKQKMLKEVQAHPEILGEAIQTLLRKEGVQDAYDRLKEFLRGKENVTMEDIGELISTFKGLNLSKETTEKLQSLLPENYLGTLIKPALKEKEKVA